MPLSTREILKHEAKARKLIALLDGAFRADGPGGKKLTLGEALKIAGLCMGLASGLMADWVD